MPPVSLSTCLVQPNHRYLDAAIATDKCIAELNGVEIAGHTLTVRRALQQPAGAAVAPGT